MAKRTDKSTAPVLRGYSNVSEISAGAFARVFRATEDETGRDVALKLLTIDSVDERRLQAFRGELQSLAKVSSHPNVVTLYRVLSYRDGQPVLVLELCSESFADAIRRTQTMNAKDACAAGVKIAGALETAHRHHFLHTDVKPQNVLVTQYGEPALSDLAVAGLQPRAHATADVLALAPLHTAPEILDGGQPSPATDVYGLASSIYQMLGGLPPFAAADGEAAASVILRIIRDPVRPLRSEHVPLALADLLEASLAKDPNSRPPSAGEFAAALLAIESANGWAPTPYVAWGEEEEGPTPGAEPATPPPVQAHSESAPSVHVADVAHERSSPPHLVGTPTRVSPMASAPREQAEPVVWWSGQTVSSPPLANRNVVAPPQSGRGHHGPDQPDVPVPPLMALDAPMSGASDVPVFVDPGTAGAEGAQALSHRDRGLPRDRYNRAASTRSVYARPKHGSAGAQRSTVPMTLFWVAGLAVASLVIVAAVMLIFGVI